MRSYTLNRAGNLQDVHNSIQCGWERVTIEDLERALEDEQKRFKRKSFIQLLERCLRKKRKEVANV